MAMCLCWSERRVVLVSSFLQVLGQQSTERHDSEHRGPAVVAYAPVSWKTGDDRVTCLRWSED
jgi:hypothetical protein